MMREKNNKVKKLVTAILGVLLVSFFCISINTNIYAQNYDFDFLFDFEGDVCDSVEKYKIVTNDSAYVWVTTQELSGASFKVRLMANNEYDGDYEASYNSPNAQLGDEIYLRNSVPAGEIVWIRGSLNRAGGIFSEGCIFRGRWRPDVSR